MRKHLLFLVFTLFSTLSYAYNQPEAYQACLSHIVPSYMSCVRHDVSSASLCFIGLNNNTGNYAGSNYCWNPATDCPSGQERLTPLSACTLTCTAPQVLNSVINGCYTPPACNDPTFPLLSLNATTGYKTCTSACSITDGAVCYTSPSQSYCDVNGSIFSPVSMCIPTCDAGTQWYNAVTNKCDAQSSCTYPLMRDPVTNSCVTDPNSCGSTSHVDPVTGQCVLNPLVCHAAHTHANATNDHCDPDPPRQCDPGQHDDGTVRRQLPCPIGDNYLDRLNNT